jgi:hypothetical protein
VCAGEGLQGCWGFLCHRCFAAASSTCSCAPCSRVVATCAGLSIADKPGELARLVSSLDQDSLGIVMLDALAVALEPLVGARPCHKLSWVFLRRTVGSAPILVFVF